MAPVAIKGGTIVTADDEHPADMLIENGKVATIGADLPVGERIEVHDATGLLLLPGGVDVHTHMDFDLGTARTADTFGSGTRAAAFGGTTTIIDFANQARRNLEAALDEWRGRSSTACVDVSAHMVVNMVDDNTLNQMATLIDDEGVTSFKLFMAYPDLMMVDDASMFRVMEVARDRGAMVCVHAENGPMTELLREKAVAEGHTGPKYHMLTRPSILEAEATHRAIRLAELAGTSVYFVHLSAAEALDEVKRARERGLSVFAETCPHYLFLTLDEYDRPDFEGAKYVMAPPLRERRHLERLWDGLAAGELQVVSTDHCPFCFTEEALGMRHSKRQGRDDFTKIPNGVPGIETRLPLVYDEGVHRRGWTSSQVVSTLSTKPAQLFGLFPAKGTLAEGSDADVVLFDPNEEWTINAEAHNSRVDYSLYEGRRVKGRVKKVFLRGDLVVDGDEWLGREGMGRFLTRSPVELNEFSG